MLLLSKARSSLVSDADFLDFHTVSPLAVRFRSDKNIGPERRAGASVLTQIIQLL